MIMLHDQLIDEASKPTSHRKLNYFLFGAPSYNWEYVKSSSTCCIRIAFKSIKCSEHPKIVTVENTPVVCCNIASRLIDDISTVDDMSK
mmetsp:Transcript_47896/g.116507  ORF Transcript_47896/g.116507 Transcript_47896/m.116507 type:complete len:89 (+) Transcript_47896:8-274(+)